MVGRDVAADRRSRRAHPADVGARGRGPPRHGRPRPRGGPRRRASRSAPARSSGSPAWRATARTSWSRRSSGCGKPTSGTVTLDGRDITAASPRDLHEPGVGVRARPIVTGSGSCCRFPIADNLVLNDYYNPPFARGSVRDDARHRTRAADERSTEFDVRTPSADGDRRDAVGWQPAEGRRRPRVRPRPEAARPRPADARPRRRQHRVHPSRRSIASATRAPRCCSSRPSSTRCSSSPTGSA